LLSKQILLCFIMHKYFSPFYT